MTKAPKFSIVGPLGLSIDIGVPGQMSHERVLELIDHVREVCRRRNIQYGTIASSAEEVHELVEAGTSWVAVGSEMVTLSEAWKKASQAKGSGTLRFNRQEETTSC